MEISRKDILGKTHYGLNIYAYILRQFYPGDTVLSLSGRDCKPARNPFNQNRLTLMVSIVDNCARHTDTDKSIPDGDVFDFAQLHYKKEGQELLETINRDLHLHIGENRGFYGNRTSAKEEPDKQNIEKPIVRIPQCSYFNRPVSNTIPARTVNLNEIYHLIKGDSFYKATSTLRSIEDVREARKYKAANFDYVTFSGTFSKRNDKALLAHSGLLTIDFDHITDIDSLKRSLLHDPYFETEMLFISPSGNGLKWIIPIDITKAKHQDFFRAVSNYIRQTYKLEVDQSGKDISRACFIPHDAAVYINPKYLE